MSNNTEIRANNGDYRHTRANNMANFTSTNGYAELSMDLKEQLKIELDEHLKPYKEGGKAQRFHFWDYKTLIQAKELLDTVQVMRKRKALDIVLFKNKLKGVVASDEPENENEDEKLEQELLRLEQEQIKKAQTLTAKDLEEAKITSSESLHDKYIKNPLTSLDLARIITKEKAEELTAWGSFSQTALNTNIAIKKAKENGKLAQFVDSLTDNEIKAVYTSSLYFGTLAKFWDKKGTNRNGSTYTIEEAKIKTIIDPVLDLVTLELPELPKLQGGLVEIDGEKYLPTGMGKLAQITDFAVWFANDHGLVSANWTQCIMRTIYEIESTKALLEDPVDQTAEAQELFGNYKKAFFAVEIEKSKLLNNKTEVKKLNKSFAKNTPELWEISVDRQQGFRNLFSLLNTEATTEKLKKDKTKSLSEALKVEVSTLKKLIKEREEEEKLKKLA